MVETFWIGSKDLVVREETNLLDTKIEIIAIKDCIKWGLFQKVENHEQAHNWL